jgi:uncharacterized protein
LGPEESRCESEKYGVSFEETSTVFHDTLLVTGSDPDHSGEEQRFVTFGNSRKDRLLVVAHTDEAKLFA